MRHKRLPHSDRALANLATRQHGVVSIRQLQRLGFDRSAVTRAVSAGRLHRLHRGVYAVGHRRLTWHGHCLAAVLANSPAVASHFSAAWLWGLLRTRPSGAFHLTAPNPRHPKPEFALHHARLAGEDREMVDGIPATSLARTQLDLAARLPADRLENVLERSDERGDLDLRRLEALLDRTRGHPGQRRLRTALDLYRPDPDFSRSKLERRFLALVKKAGLPRPSLNFNFAEYELDVYWPRQRFAVELDVFETHGSRAAFERDRRRQEELKLLGVEMIRITDRRLKREPAATIERVGLFLERRP
ncbi:MAG: type IV toxin-antitoxin system AbiEi family antitoxin domain-containing protein [Solirubrobacterales bacterium]